MYFFRCHSDLLNIYKLFSFVAYLMAFTSIPSTAAGNRDFMSSKDTGCRNSQAYPSGRYVRIFSTMERSIGSMFFQAEHAYNGIRGCRQLLCSLDQPVYFSLYQFPGPVLPVCKAGHVNPALCCERYIIWNLPLMIFRFSLTAIASTKHSIASFQWFRNTHWKRIIFPGRSYTCKLLSFSLDGKPYPFSESSSLSGKHSKEIDYRFKQQIFWYLDQ